MADAPRCGRVCLYGGGGGGVRVLIPATSRIRNTAFACGALYWRSLLLTWFCVRVLRHVRRRILEIIKNIGKQKVEITKVLGDTRLIQKEFNVVTEKLQRTYMVTDELIFKVPLAVLDLRACLLGMICLRCFSLSWQAASMHGSLLVSVFA